MKSERVLGVRAKKNSSVSINVQIKTAPESATLNAVLCEAVTTQQIRYLHIPVRNGDLWSQVNTHTRTHTHTHARRLIVPF